MNSSNDFLDEDTRPKIIPVTDFNYKYPQTFEELDLPPPILTTLCDEYRRPNRMQSVTMKLITALPNKNLVAQARSGSGKELSYVVGMFQKLCISLAHKPQAMLICPTIELAEKMYKLVGDVGKHHTEFLARLVVDLEDDMDVIEHIVIGVPSTLRRLIDIGKMDLADIKMVILDELDYVLKAGMDAEIVEILSAIHAKQQGSGSRKNLYQMIVFYSSLTDPLRRFVPRIAPQHNINMLFVNQEEFSVFKTDLFRIPIYGGAQEKEESVSTILEVLLCTNEHRLQAVIFVNPKTNIRFLKWKLDKAGYEMVVAQDNDDYDGYNDPLLEFKLGKVAVLITHKPICPPGFFDQSKVRIVIFYDLPVTPDGRNDDPVYYRIATKAGTNCEEGYVFHLVDPEHVDRMNRIENHFSRSAKLLSPITSLMGFSEFVDALLQASLIKSEYAASLKYLRANNDRFDDAGY